MSAIGCYRVRPEQSRQIESWIIIDRPDRHNWAAESGTNSNTPVWARVGVQAQACRKQHNHWCIHHHYQTGNFKISYRFQFQRRQRPVFDDDAHRFCVWTRHKQSRGLRPERLQIYALHLARHIEIYSIWMSLKTCAAARVWCGVTQPASAERFG